VDPGERASQNIRGQRSGHPTALASRLLPGFCGSSGRQALLRTALGFALESLSNDKQVVGENSGTHQQLKTLTPVQPGALHSAAAKEHGDTTFDSGAKALAFLECALLLFLGALGTELSTSLRDACHFDLHLFAGLLCLGAVKATVPGVEIGCLAKRLAVLLQGGLDLIGVARVPVKHLIVRDQADRALSHKDLVTELDGLVCLATYYQIGVRLEEGIDLLLGRHRFPVEHTAAGLVDDALCERSAVCDLVTKGADEGPLDQVGNGGSTRLFDHLGGCADDLRGRSQQIGILAPPGTLALAYKRLTQLE